MRGGCAASLLSQERAEKWGKAHCSIAVEKFGGTLFDCCVQGQAMNCNSLKINDLPPPKLDRFLLTFPKLLTKLIMFFRKVCNSE